MNYQKIVETVYQRVTDKLIEWNESVYFRRLYKQNIDSLIMSIFLEEFKKGGTFHSKYIRRKVHINSDLVVYGTRVTEFRGFDVCITDERAIDFFQHKYSVNLKYLEKLFNEYDYKPLVFKESQSNKPQVNDLLDLSELQNFSFTI